MKTIIQTQTPDIEMSKDFYSRLGFKPVGGEDTAMFTDGKFIIEINPDPHVRAGLKIYSEGWTKTAEILGKTTVVLETKDGYMAADPNGVRVYLVNGDLEAETGEESFGATGNFSGISIESVVPAQTVEFWTAIGFDKSQGDLAQGWAVFSNGGGIDVSIMKANMCPHLFFNPGLTFFNSGNNLENIKKLSDAEIPFTQEITCFNEEGIVDNVIINDPGGLGFFVFND